MVAQQFEKVTYACGKYNNFQNSKSIFMIGDFEISSIVLFRHTEFGALSVKQLFQLMEKEKLHFSSIQFLLLLSERGLGPKGCLVIFHPRASCLQTSYRISSNNRPQRLFNFDTVRCLYNFKIREMNNMKLQNLAIFSFKIRMKHKFSLLINQI